MGLLDTIHDGRKRHVGRKARLDWSMAAYQCQQIAALANKIAGQARSEAIIPRLGLPLRISKAIATSKQLAIWRLAITPFTRIGCLSKCTLFARKGNPRRSESSRGSTVVPRKRLEAWNLECAAQRRQQLTSRKQAVEWAWNNVEIMTRINEVPRFLFWIKGSRSGRANGDKADT
jgi:hypothetical protein